VKFMQLGANLVSYNTDITLFSDTLRRELAAVKRCAGIAGAQGAAGV